MSLRDPLTLERVTKRYLPASALERVLTVGRAPSRAVLAVDDVSMRVGRGEIVGLIGPNGSGKSTLLRCCAGLICPSSGSVQVMGQDPASHAFEHRGRIGVVLRDDRTFHLRMSGRENLRLFARLQQIPRRRREALIAEVLATADLYAVADQPYRTYSTGMKQRLAFARALLGAPVLLLLDEASSGLDPGLRESFQERVKEIASTGVGALLATHDLEEAKRTCDRFIVLRDGRVRAEGLWGDVAPTIAETFGGGAT